MTPRTKTPSAPPPVRDGFRIIEFASTKRPVKYSGHSGLFVDAKELGPVPHLAVGEHLDSKDLVLLHMNARWQVLGIQGGFQNRDAAKKRAEHMYPGVSAVWVKTHVSRSEAREYESALWEDLACSFCGRIPRKFSEAAVSRTGAAVICDICIRELHQGLKHE